jgi:hypothetical protein
MDFFPPKNRITFQYLVREGEKFSLIKDNYRLRTPTSEKRFRRNYGFEIGNDIETIILNECEIKTPSKIWVDANNRMQRFAENTKKVSAIERENYFVDKRKMNFEKWYEIVKIEVFNNQIFYDEKDKLFKVFRVKIFGHDIIFNEENKSERLIDISCKITESDLDRVCSKEYLYFTQKYGDIDQWKSEEGKIFIKQSCFDCREQIK